MGCKVSSPRMSIFFSSMLFSNVSTVERTVSEISKSFGRSFSSPLSMRERFNIVRTRRERRLTSSETMCR